MVGGKNFDVKPWSIVIVSFLLFHVGGLLVVQTFSVVNGGVPARYSFLLTILVFT